ncbi:Cysteine-rich receptor-like protein kinase 25 [Glycine soja]|uniref:Cysteine-rich receptor-like protein kinase 25 n=1 Tax=Glycine soja TaxID=3848 RepID=A0A0B2R2D7_GLYSO|nr:Cysteine-rich receptor-like protein kinase 25 [Glycine soja]
MGLLLLIPVPDGFLNFATIQAQEEESSTPVYLFHNCSGGNTTAYSTFQLNLWTLLSSLTSNAVSSTGFYNTTVIEANPSNSVFGLFTCRGDVPPQLCQQCVINATQRLRS